MQKETDNNHREEKRQPRSLLLKIKVAEWDAGRAALVDPTGNGIRAAPAHAIQSVVEAMPFSHVIQIATKAKGLVVAPDPFAACC